MFLGLGFTYLTLSFPLMNDVITPPAFKERVPDPTLENRTDKRLYNYIDDNALINQLLAPLEVGQKVDTCQCCELMAKLSGPYISQI
jgi:hypothetical protein